jgi:hypothetical protein
MLGGFVGVYLVDNIVLMPRALKISHASISCEAASEVHGVAVSSSR